MVSGFRLKEIIKLKKSCMTLNQKKFMVEVPALVSKSQTITKSISLIKGLKNIEKGQKVLVKPNINSDDVYPGTSRVQGLIELIRLLKNKKAIITVGDMSSAFWSHTNTCAERAGIKQACKREGVPFVAFENTKWVKKELPGTSLKSCYLTDELCRHDHLINLCVLKTHRLADFTLSLKNLMGLLHMRTRMQMHCSKLKQRIGEFNTSVTPCLNIVDGTKCFIDGGPDKGELRKSRVILSSRDRVALDVVCVNLLKSLGSRSLENVNAWKHPQIKSAVKHGVGVKNEDEIELIT